nr:MAG TPA: hypothetical protein [Caudoviricetes sp.]
MKKDFMLRAIVAFCFVLYNTVSILFAQIPREERDFCHWLALLFVLYMEFTLLIALTN